jgi:hypothetical protein
MPTKTKRSLADVVAEERSSKACMLCEIPEQEELEREYSNGAQIRHIAEYLIKDRGYPVDKVDAQRQSRMSKHFRFHKRAS